LRIPPKTPEPSCTVWLENPYFQAFCGADYFQHERPFNRASMTRWRQRIGAKALECLLAETIAVAAKTEAVSQYAQSNTQLHDQKTVTFTDD
jgi:IS5 family transposase